MFFIGDIFPKQLSLDSFLESWDLNIGIPRRKLRIWSYSQVETRLYRSKYLKIYFLICFFSYPVFFLIGSLGYLILTCCPTDLVIFLPPPVSSGGSQPASLYFHKGMKEALQRCCSYLGLLIVWLY